MARPDSLATQVESADLDVARCGPVTLRGELQALHDLALCDPGYKDSLLRRRVDAALSLPEPAPPASDETAADLQAAEQALDAIATRVRQVGDALEPVDTIAKASARARYALPRLQRAIAALGA